MMTLVSAALLAALAVSVYFKDSAHEAKKWDIYIVLTTVTAVLTAFAVLLLLTRISIGSRALSTLAAASLEIYLIQGVFIVLMRPYIQNDIIYIAAALVLTVTVGVLMERVVHKAVSLILNFELSLFRQILVKFSKNG